MYFSISLWALVFFFYGFVVFLFFYSLSVLLMMMFLIKKLCPVCGKTLSSFQRVREHLFSAHAIAIVSRTGIGRRRDEVVYSECNKKRYPNGIVRFGCPSCLVHWDTIPNLRQHVLDQHLYR